MQMFRSGILALVWLFVMGATLPARAFDLGGQQALVIASRASEGDVIAFLDRQAGALADLPPGYGTRIYLSDNGWYAIAIGVFGPRECDNRLTRLLRRDAVPSDSYCSGGERYLAEFTRAGSRLVLAAGALPKTVEPAVETPVVTPVAPAPAATPLRDIITGTRWSVFEGPCTAESVNYQEFTPEGYRVTIRGEASTGQMRVNVFQVDEVTGRFVMEYETYSPMQAAPWSVVTVEGRLLPDGRLETEEVIRTTTLETIGAVRPVYDSVVEQAVLSPCVGIAEAPRAQAVPEITLLPNDIGPMAEGADCEDTFDAIRRVRTLALNLTTFAREGGVWAWSFVPTESCLADQTNMDLGLCGLEVEGTVRVALDKPGMVVTYAVGTCTFESRLSGVRGLVDAVTTARGENGAGLPCMDGVQRTQALVCLDGP